jgi:hypothetical protein
MKPIAVLVIAGALSLGAVAASAKTVTVPQKDNDRVVAGVSGTTPDKNKVPSADAATAQDQSALQPSKKELKASKVRTPPPLHDPN